MRISSIKSVSLATAFVVALAAAPFAEARSARPGDNMFRSVKATLTQLINRFFGIRAQTDLPSDPIPRQKELTNADGTATTDLSSTVTTTPK